MGSYLIFKEKDFTQMVQSWKDTDEWHIDLWQERGLVTIRTPIALGIAIWLIFATGLIVGAIGWQVLAE